MKIVLGIVAALLLLIMVVLLLPAYVIIKSDDHGEPSVRFRLLWMTFGGDSNSPVSRARKKSSGSNKPMVDKPAKDEKSDFAEKLQQVLNIVLQLCREVVRLSHRCTLTRCELDVLCAKGDAAEIAISYGKCCAVVYPFIGVVQSLMRVRERGRKIAVRYDFSGNEVDAVTYHVVLSIQVFRVVAALLRVLLAEVKRKVAREATG